MSDSTIVEELAAGYLAELIDSESNAYETERPVYDNTFVMVHSISSKRFKVTVEEAE